MGLSRVTGRLHPTATRVEESTAPARNREIRRNTEASVARVAANQEEIEHRLRELDQEWDIERTLQTNFAIVNIVSLILGALVARPWFLLTGVAAGFMVKHAREGWCPPVPVFRRMGFRTAREIARERYALKALRGDFEEIGRDQPGKAFENASISFQ
jgi:hypothetical protein